MTDETAAPGPGPGTLAPVQPPPAAASLAQDALHYAAGAGLLALSAWAAQAGLLDKQVLSTLIAGAALGVGFKLKG